MTDRRRLNGPAGGTAPLVYASLLDFNHSRLKRPYRTREPNELRKIFLKTGLTPSASGSAYLELEPPTPPDSKASSLIPASSVLKLTCTVHGPRPLPRSAPFTPHVVLSTHVKFGPFASRQRRGYIRDSLERDLAVHLETALRGVIIGDRWPKSGVEVIVTVLEGEEDRWCGDEALERGVGSTDTAGWGAMTVLAGCITVASAAIAEAGIDCVDLVTGGVAAAVTSPKNLKTVPSSEESASLGSGLRLVMDPAPSEHVNIRAACVVAYLSSRDELTELWLKGDLPVVDNEAASSGDHQEANLTKLTNAAVHAAISARSVLEEAVRESANLRVQNPGVEEHRLPGDSGLGDVAMVS
ncbi:MAG: 3'-5'-exoribonuclease [Caeruleum heppii]|nr:MAG: 3'-5'-exoribonuclease [Caeruleum heppii]